MLGWGHVRRAVHGCLALTRHLPQHSRASEPGARSDPLEGVPPEPPRDTAGSGTPLRTAGTEADFPRQDTQPPACLMDGEVDVSAIWGHSLDRGQCLSPHDICSGILGEEPQQGGTAQGHA